jgi:hypothetical protein
VASFVAPTLSANAASAVSSAFGSSFDIFRFQLGASNTQNANQSFNISNYLYGSTIGVGQQLTNKLYVGLNTGLCQFKSGSSVSALSGVGGNLEFRFNPRTSMQLGVDPGTQARSCGLDAQSIAGLVPTPTQFSLSLFHTWRF